MHFFRGAHLRALITGVILTSGVARAAEQPSHPGRPWTPETSIGMRYFSLNFSAPQHWPSPSDRPGGVLFSPDGRYFLYVEYRGDVVDDSAVAGISVYRSDDVRRALRSRATRIAPLHRFETRSRSSMNPAIGDIRWDEDSKGLLFESPDQSGTPHVYFFDVASGAMTSIASLGRLSPDDSDPLFGFRNGTSLLFTATLPRRPPPSYPGQWIDRTANGTPAFADEVWRATRSGPTGISRREARCEGRPAPAPDIATRVGSLAISPTGCRAILLVQRESRDYDYHLLDISTGRSRVIAAAGNGSQSASWSADGRWALLPNLKTGDGGARSSLAMLSLETGELQTVEGVAASLRNFRMRPRWLSADAVIAADANSPSGASHLELRNGRWTRLANAEFPTESRPDQNLEVGVRQSLNEPARMVARAGRTEITLSEPDPVLAGVARREWQEISFVAPDGRTARAALMLPARRPDQSGPPPLVVNPYAYENNGGSHVRLFLPDGQHDGAESAAQMLAARGFAVLWMDMWDSDGVVGTPSEGPGFVARLDAVLSDLIRQGLVDRERIGMASYSRGGYLTLFSATHPGRIPIRTHIAIDNFLGSIQNAFYFKTYGADLNALNVFADRPGALERDTMTNVDRVRGPVLFTHNTGSEGKPRWPLQVMQGAFMLARRPFDELHFSGGAHNLMRPRERLTLMNAIVDWMAFWLMDQTPTDPERARVWTRMRADWQRQQAWEAAGNPVASTPPADFRPVPAQGTR